MLSKSYRPLIAFLPSELFAGDQPADRQLARVPGDEPEDPFGNLKNVLDESSSQTEILVLDSPFVGNAQWDELTASLMQTWPRSTVPFAARCRSQAASGLERIRAEAEDAVRSGAGHLVLTDQIRSRKSGDADDPCDSAVHQHLTRKGLRTFCSLNVRSAECD